MKKLLAILALGTAFAHIAAHAAEWLTAGGDSRRTGWQKREKSLNTGNAHLLKLLWKRRLDNQSIGQNSLTAPTMLGPIITHRGIKELVLIAGSSDNVYAVDADLGRVFWEKRLESAAALAGRSCAAGLTAAPVIAPPTAPMPDDDEGSTPLRPFYALASDGRLHTLRPSDGEETNAPVKFVPPNTIASNLNLFGKSIYTIAGACGETPQGAWRLDVSRPGAAPNFSASKQPDGSGFAIGSGGAIYFAPIGTPVVFDWKGRELVVAAERGRLLLKGGNSVLASQPVSPELLGGLAAAEDSVGHRWIYAATQDGVAAFQVSEAGSRLTEVWKSPDMPAPAPPVIANGIVFVLSSPPESNRATLYAMDAATGNRLYSSGAAVASTVGSSGLAVANGHVCFGTSDNTLYCFGIPIEI